MTPMLWIPVATALGIIVTAAVTWLVARQQHSGRIETSEAASLWDESQAMRRELREEVGVLRTRLAELSAQLAEANTKLSEAQYTVALLRNEVRECRSALGVTSTDVQAIRRDMATARSLSDYATEQRQAARRAETDREDPAS